LPLLLFYYYFFILCVHFLVLFIAIVFKHICYAYNIKNTFKTTDWCRRLLSKSKI